MLFLLQTEEGEDPESLSEAASEAAESLGSLATSGGSLEPGDMNAWLSQLVEVARGFGVNLLAALAILLLGLYLSRFIGKMARRALERSKLDDTVTNFLANLVSYVLIAFVIIAALSRLGSPDQSVRRTARCRRTGHRSGNGGFFVELRRRSPDRGVSSVQHRTTGSKRPSAKDRSQTFRSSTRRC